MHDNHMKHLLIGGAGLLAVLLVFGVPLAIALPYALFLACPLMMLMMMRSMGGGQGGGHDHGADQPPGPAERIEAPTGSISEDGFTPTGR